MESCDLVPGDTILLEGQQLSVPCDVVLLDGSCVLDEGMLTGTLLGLNRNPFLLGFFP